MNEKELLASINPSTPLDDALFRNMYCKGMSNPDFPEQAIVRLESVGRSEAREQYRAWVEKYESEREAMLDRVAHWWYMEECKKDRERERKVRNSIAGNRKAGYRFAGFPEDW